jgi:hypothetical protein
VPEDSFPVKRSVPRFSFVADAELAEMPGETRLVARVSELSLRGCYVDTMNDLPVGTKLRLRIRYGSSTCEVDGKVIYAHGGIGMGVAFGEMTPEKEAVLAAWLAELARKAGN